MLRVIGVGDNTVDQYVHLNRMFPGGNAVNFAVHARRYGHGASYLGWLGDDIYGNLILEALREEDVDTSRCRILNASNARCEVNLVDGERVFGETDPGVCPLIQLNKEDFDYIREHDITHTSTYSYLEEELPNLSEASLNLSFDFSQEFSKEYLEKTLHWIDFAFLSQPDRSLNQIRDLMKWAHMKGPKIVVVTRGDKGSLCYDGKQYRYQEVIETNIVDTLGAGDAFAARFLVDYLSGASIEESMAEAAKAASEACKYYGAFGSGILISHPDIDQ